MALADIRESVEKFLLALQSAFQARAMYGEAHKLTKEALGEAHSMMQGAVLSRPDVTLGVVGEMLIFDKQPLHRLARTAALLTGLLIDGKIEKVSFLKAATRDELGAFLALVEARRKLDANAAAAIDTSGLRNIVIEGLGIDESRDGRKADRETNPCAAYYTEGVDVLGDIAQSIGDKRAIDADKANAFINKILGRLLENKSPLLIAASLKKHDEYSFVHSLNVAVISLAQAQGLGMSAPLVAEIGMAGFLHDSGKLALAGQVLRKKEKLSEDEFAKVKSHPLDGAKLLMLTPGIHPLIAVAAFEHHVRYDKKGYPTKVFGGDLNLGSMIVAIADVYDALRSVRSYKEGMTPEKVYEEMHKMSGTHFHPDLLEAFFSSVGVFPPGTMVELDDGHVGIVIAENDAEIRQPIVEVWYAKGGAKERQPYVVDLAEKGPGGSYRHTVLTSMLPTEVYEIPAKYRVD